MQTPWAIILKAGVPERDQFRIAHGKNSIDENVVQTTYADKVLQLIATRDYLEKENGRTPKYKELFEAVAVTDTGLLPQDDQSDASKKGTSQDTTWAHFVLWLGGPLRYVKVIFVPRDEKRIGVTDPAF